MAFKLAAVKTFTLEQVSAHSTPSDLWLVIYNNVYDITGFIKEHPGGGEVLFDCGGADATEAFEDVGHSQDAVDMLAPYLVGSLSPQELRLYSKNEKTVTQKNRKQAKQSGYRELAALWMGLILVALLVVVALQKAHWINLTTH